IAQCPTVPGQESQHKGEAGVQVTEPLELVGMDLVGKLTEVKPPDKSRLAQMKARWRSSVGVRGSPETNSLIRFMAQQRMKTLAGSRTPE
ncbi:hypothetical protein KUCAC02_004311, partial [Chaenocephalus aceratus]